MNDTTPKIAIKMEQLLQEKTPTERLVMGCSMFDLSKDLVLNSIRNNSPNISGVCLRQELFLRFYGNDFNVVQQQKITQYLSKKN